MLYLGRLKIFVYLTTIFISFKTTFLIKNILCFIKGDLKFSWRVKELDNPHEEGPRLKPFRPRSLKTKGSCEWLLCSSRKLGMLF